MSDPPHPKYTTLAMVHQWAPFSTRDFPDANVDHLIESASSEVMKKSGNYDWQITDEAYDDIEIITAYLTGSMIQATIGDIEKSKWYRELAMSKLKVLLDSGTVTGPGGVKVTSVKNVFSSVRSYYAANTLDPEQTIVKPYKSRY